MANSNASNDLGTPGGTTVSLGDLDANAISNAVAPGQITINFSFR